jgi:hypothetical protein
MAWLIARRFLAAAIFSARRAQPTILTILKFRNTGWEHLIRVPFLQIASRRGHFCLGHGGRRFLRHLLAAPRRDQDRKLGVEQLGSCAERVLARLNVAHGTSQRAGMEPGA